MARSVREPIQVYLSSDERDDLDRVARSLGISRSEVLRRGLRAVSGPAGSSERDPDLPPWITPATAGPGTAPPSLPVAPLRELLAELAEDREDG